ncbi:MAG TPA: polysaccharide deacetylase family protein [Hyphomonadaceae bacterium]|nr:polysaccharide deacetylase family protein [Hyphomonadaceae bacterium]
MFRAGLSVAGALGAMLAFCPAALADCKAGQPLREVTLVAGQNVGDASQGFAAPPLHDHEVVLTFDDGPDPATTIRVLELLKADCLVASFFPLGVNAQDHPDLIRREIEEGHVVGSHTNDHANLAGEAQRDAIDDIKDGIAKVSAAGGTPTLFRFPQLVATQPLLDWLRSNGIAAVGVNIDSLDWQGGPPEATLKKIEDGLRANGRGIILMHDVQPNTVKLLPALFDFLDRGGYRVVRLSGPPRLASLHGGFAG